MLSGKLQLMFNPIRKSRKTPFGSFANAGGCLEKFTWQVVFLRTDDDDDVALRIPVKLRIRWPKSELEGRQGGQFFACEEAMSFVERARV